MSKRKDRRGKGIGKFVFEYIIDYAKNMGVESIELDVYECNETAVHLYKSMGMNNRYSRMELKL
ncbi:GNAT family N-acetyltransferase [Heyndrickxia shackletonii]|uniref:GNAT family N-acetyltransferase n=1 Tax=Heyndrickxia shackletonii TaxID=157838 RepID=UPI0009F9B928|nr:GNAT family N-acetyltransferase [Heyndrickxia shackletonii]